MPLRIIFSQVAVPSRPPLLVFTLHLSERPSGCVEDEQTRSSVCRFLTKQARHVNADLRRSLIVRSLLAWSTATCYGRHTMSNSQPFFCLPSRRRRRRRRCMAAWLSASRINTSRVQYRDAARMRYHTPTAETDGVQLRRRSVPI